MSQKFNVAVLGATGLVGRQIIETLEDRKFPGRPVIFTRKQP